MVCKLVERFVLSCLIPVGKSELLWLLGHHADLLQNTDAAGDAQTRSASSRQAAYNQCKSQHNRCESQSLGVVPEPCGEVNIAFAPDKQHSSDHRWQLSTA